MDTFFSTASHNFTFDENEETADNLSMKMNRSRLLLSEFGTDSTNLFKSSSSHYQQQQQQQLHQLKFQENKSLHVISKPQIQTELLSTQQSSIYAQFKLDTNKLIDEESNLVDLLSSYSNICIEHVQFLQEKIQCLKMNRQKQDQLNATLTELDELEKEKNLWHLMHTLYLDEQVAKENEMYVNEELDEKEAAIGIDEALLVEHLLRKKPMLRKIKLVIEWLEKIASESKSLESVRQKIGEFPEKCLSWEHTLHHLKNVNQFNKKEKHHFSNREFVDELDPDAPIREEKPLHDLDQEDEYKLMEYIYSFIRAGELTQARDFCFKIGQSWRAASLEGFKLFSDKNYSNNRLDSNQLYLNEGNLNRDIWRLMVQRLIKDESFSPYEKAAYASLAGFVGPILPVCRTYMDFVWAYFKALYANIIDKEIRQRMSTLREFSNVPYDNDEDYFFNGINKSSSYATLPTVAQIFERIGVLISNSGVGSVSVGSFIDKNSGSSGGGLVMSGHLVANLKADSQKPFSVILKHVILSGIDGFKSGTNELMEYLKTFISTNHQQSGLLLRFSSHLSLFYRSAAFQLKDETFVEINEHYVQYLIEHNYRDIVAYYLSQLPSDIQIRRYSKFLQTITDNKERQMLLKLAKERNMNVQAITLNIVDNLSRNSLTRSEMSRSLIDETGLSTTAFIGKTTELFTFKTGQTLTDEDRTKINAIDWIVYDTVQRLKLLEYANLTMRYFLLERQNFEATKLVFSKIPQDTLTVVLSQYNFSNSAFGQHSSSIEANFQQILDNLPLNVTNTIKEYLCIKEYIDAVNAYNDWFDFFHKEKPVKPLPKFDLDQAQLNQQQSGLDQTNIFAERIAFDYQLKQYDDLLVRWNSKARVYSDKVRSKFMSILKFPFGGWMIDVQDSSSETAEDTNIQMAGTSSDSDADMDEMDGDSVMQPAGGESQLRKLQMKALKKLYLPNICFVLVDMLAKMKHNKELIRTSDLVASESYKLYELFDNRQLKCFISKVADASICLLEDGDYFGYN